MTETADASTQTALCLIQFPSTDVEDFGTPPPSPVSEPPSPISDPPSPFSEPPPFGDPECKRCGADLFYCDRMDHYFCLSCG